MVSSSSSSSVGAGAASRNAALALGFGLLSASAVTLLLLRQPRWWRKRDGEEEEDFDQKGPRPALLLESQAAESSPDAAHSLKSRVGNFKVSRLSRLVEDIAVACGSDFRLDVSANSTAVPDEEEIGEQEEFPTASGQTQTKEAQEIAFEQQALEEAIEILRRVRRSAVHRKLPHFHAVDRQLENAELHLEDIFDNVAGFWRYGREEPMADLLRLPIMQLAASGGKEALVPVPDELLLQTSSSSSAPPSSAEAEAQAVVPGAGSLEGASGVLGLTVDASRRDVEVAYRSRARDLHRHGECIDRAAFHALTEAYERCVLRRDAVPNSVYAGGGDTLAHYLLIGTNPGGSRYREYSRGILDATHRERLLQKIDVLRNWGEVSGSTTGLGQG